MSHHPQAAGGEIATRTGWHTGGNSCSDGVVRPFLFHVPHNRDPGVPIPLLVVLHGAVRRPDLKVEGRIPGLEEIWGRILKSGAYVLAAPITNQDAPWWCDKGAEHVLGVIREVKDRCNIDENRIVCVGNSDGGAGAYYLAGNHSTPFAAFLCLSSWLPAAGMGGCPLFLSNLVPKPVYAIHGARDHLFDCATAAAHVENLRRAGVDATFRCSRTGGHPVSSYWRSEGAAALDFMSRAVRNPFPQRVDWECTHPSRGRCHWIRIDEIGNHRASGRLQACRQLNRIDVVTHNVARYTLLLSEAMIDFSRPVEVFTDGKPSYAGIVDRAPDFTRAQMAIDRDRCMVFHSGLTFRTGS